MNPNPIQLVPKTMSNYLLYNLFFFQKDFLIFGEAILDSKICGENFSVGIAKKKRSERDRGFLRKVFDFLAAIT